ncbi:hypothetical protein [Streptomyces sp. NPDC091212]|uniref:hypothetical protein n=1 Tax=Streptomyces sp. NPDC091212 TaxID=3155191 RepID=UPI003428EA9A
MAEQLAETPDAAPEQICAILTAAGHKLTWDETVSARMPLPDERAILPAPDATPIIHATFGADQRPLLLEELRAGVEPNWPAASSRTARAHSTPSDRALPELSKPVFTYSTQKGTAQ